MSINENALLAGKGILEYPFPHYTRKRYPAYGRQLNALRLSGRIPQLRVIVTFDWDLGVLYPRIVIPENVRIDLLIFNYLAGLSVQIVYHEGEDELVNQLIKAILEVKPKTLAQFNIDYPTLKLVYPATVEELEAIEWK